MFETNAVPALLSSEEIFLDGVGLGRQSPVRHGLFLLFFCSLFCQLFFSLQFEYVVYGYLFQAVFALVFKILQKCTALQC